MSTVFGLRQCPQCGRVMQYNFDCGTAEESRVCMCCGYSQEWYLLRDEHMVIKKVGDSGWLGDYFEAIKYGVLHLQDEHGNITFMVFDKPLTDEDRQKITVLNKRKFSGPESYVTAYNPKTGELEVIYGKVPNEYAEYKPSPYFFQPKEEKHEQRAEYAAMTQVQRAEIHYQNQ